MSKEAQDQSTIQKLEDAVTSVQTSINQGFSEQLKDLFPSLKNSDNPG